MKNITAICGSLQGNSVNLELLKIVESYFSSDFRFGIMAPHLLKMPIFSEENFADQEMRACAKSAKFQLIDSDMILIGSPEYNGSVSGVVKNFIDWLSIDLSDGLGANPFYRKKIALLSVSPGAFGGMRGTMHMRDIMFQLEAIVMAPHLCLSTNHDALTAEANLRRIEAFAKKCQDFAMV